MSQRLSRFLAVALLAISSVGMVAVSFDAEARRMGGGANAGRQSSNVTQQRDAATPSGATTTQRSATAAAPAAGAAAAGTAAKSGMSRFLGPIAGIAAGLGIAALLSHMGLSGAFLEMISSLLLIGLLVFAVLFIVRRLRGGAAAPAAQAAATGGLQRTAHDAWQPPVQQPAPAPVAVGSQASTETAAPIDPSWFVPADFDTSTFLANAKKQFVEIQKIWDSGNVSGLSEYLTDDLIAEIKPQIEARGGKAEHTEVVLLNAELLGIETVSDGHLASVRYSGMLREAPGAEAFRFEEVWNLYKAEGAGWLLAGIQQIPVENN